MVLSSLIALSVAAASPSTGACPTQPEPAALTSAAFTVPSSGETLMFSAAPSFRSVRYALRVFRPSGARVGSALLIRLKRRLDCNVDDRTGEWTFTLSPTETDALFAAAADLERHGDDPNSIVLDGTSIQLSRYTAGKLVFNYSSNGLAKERLSKLVLDTMRQHVRADELPRSADWSYRAPGN